MIPRPAPDEYAPFYQRYVDYLPPEVDILAYLQEQGEAVAHLIDGLTEAQNAPYAPDKWSLKQVAGHLLDTERIFAVRALCFSRNEPAPLPGFDQDRYVVNASFEARTFTSLAQELRAVRSGTLWLFRTMPPAAWTRGGTANGAWMSTRAVPYVIAGHEQHHLRLMRERYLAVER